MIVSTRVLYAPGRQTLFLKREIHRLDTRQGWLDFHCQLLELEVSGLGSTAVLAYNNATLRLWRQIDEFWRRPSHSIESEEDLAIKGRLNAWIEPFQSGLIEVPERMSIFGTLVEKATGEFVFRGGDPHYFGDNPEWALSRQADEQRRQMDLAGACHAFFRTNRFGLAVGRVQSFKPVGDVERVLLWLAKRAEASR